MSANNTINKKFYVGEFNQQQFKQFKGSPLCQSIVANIDEFINLPRATSKEEALVKSVLYSDKIKQRVAYAIITAQKTAPIETMIGLISTAIVKKNRHAQTVAESMQVASEYIFFSSNLMSLTQTKMFNIRNTVNGKMILTNLHKVDGLDEKYFYPLPNKTATENHKCLGDYKWKSTYTETVDKLNQTAFTVLQIEEPEPIKYKSDMDKRADRPDELWMKWFVRSQIVPQMKGERFFFDWHQDYRGRMYAAGYHLHPQGNNHEKNILAFADYQNITWKGLIRIKHAIARAFGQWSDFKKVLELKAELNEALMCEDIEDKQDVEAYFEEEINNVLSVKTKLDKLTNPDKLKWFAENYTLLLEPEVAKYAENQTEFKAQMMSYHLATTTGMTNIPVEVDGTNSQMQVVSALTGCLQTAISSNVISDNKSIKDAYGILASFMSEITGLKFNRSQIKQAQMIDGYGAGRKLVTETLKEDLKDMFSEEAVDAFYEAQLKMSPTTQMIKETFQSLWDEKRTRYNWTMPNGFVVDYRPTDSYTVTVSPFGQMKINCIATLELNTKRNTGLGVNVIHSCDAYLCSEVIRLHPNNQIWTIHDGFRCHPNDVDTLIENYKLALASIVDSRLLESIIEDITGFRCAPVKKQFTGADVMKSKYCLC